MNALRYNQGAGFAADTYHTDGRRLLRIVSTEDRGRLRVIEDCRTLELMLIPTGQLEAMGLRAVAALASGDTGLGAAAVPR
jgi:predicted Ser/Thr protein kinase